MNLYIYYFVMLFCYEISIMGLYYENITFSLMASIEKVMNMICLVELVGCTMNMCMIKYYLLTVRFKIELNKNLCIRNISIISPRQS